MQKPARSFKNEILTALIALVMLGTAVGLAAVLTGGPAAPPETEAPTVVSMAPTEAPTEIPPTAAPTEPPADTATPLPTATEPPPTATTPPTAPPTATDEPTARPSNTPPPSATPAATASPEPTLPPSATPRPTRTTVPRLAASATATLRPTNPPPPSATPIPSATVTPTATLPATLTPTATDTPTATIVLVTPITPTAYACAPPPDWRPYVIRPGDNLFRISLRAGRPLQEIQRVNCIPNAASIEAGTVLYVPPSFFSSSAPTSGSTTTDTTASSIPRVVGCSASGSQITSPSAGALVTGRFTVVGSATLGNRNDEFNFYKLEVRGENDDAWVNVRQANAAVSQGALGTVNTAQFGPGHYQLRLTVVDETGNYIDPCAIRLTFR